MTVQLSGPLPPSLVVAALSKPEPDTRRHRGWMRRRGLRSVDAPDLSSGGTVCIDSEQDFVQCHHPGCCALRPLGDTECAVCGRR
jgi:hypothetical protein